MSADRKINITLDYDDFESNTRTLKIEEDDIYYVNWQHVISDMLDSIQMNV